MKRTTTCLALVGLSALTDEAAAARKFIELGWDIPDTAYLRAHHRTMEREAPFDGVIFRIQTTNEHGRAIGTEHGWDSEPWKRAWFTTPLADLKACAFEHFTDNFIRFNATPKRIEWTDDAGWAALENKLRICAWLAREASVKGIAPDFEPYGENQWQFQLTNGLSFVETAALARKRGAQFARGIAAEKPDAVVLTLFLNSVVLKAGRAADPDAALAKEHYGLLPAFLNGLLDAAPPEMTIVDGCENGYYLDSVEAYQRAALDMRSWNGPAIRLVAPENRARYRAQVQVGFGFYLDMFLNEEGNTYYRGPLEGSRLKHLARNLMAARDAADEYVWIYGEQCRWWSGLADKNTWLEERLKKTVGKGRLWNDALPGVNRAIDWTRDGEAAARSELASLRQSGQATNRLINGDFGRRPDKPDALPPGWSAWQDEQHPRGLFVWDEAGEGSGRASKVARGCLLQKIPVAPDETYFVEADCSALDPAKACLTVRWQSPDGKWVHEIDDKTFTFLGPETGRKTSGLVTVPEGVGQLVILLEARDQRGTADDCRFDNVAAYRLDGPIGR